MPETFSELLPATRSQARRGFYWKPCPAGWSGRRAAGGHEGEEGHRLPADRDVPRPRLPAGRAFQLRKVDGTTYHLHLADDRPHSTCDCPGHTYANTERADKAHGDRFETLGCVHLDAVATLVWNGWLPESRTNPAADVASTEVERAGTPRVLPGDRPVPRRMPVLNDPERPPPPEDRPVTTRHL